jgi:hypothetical protein
MLQLAIDQAAPPRFAVREGCHGDPADSHRRLPVQRAHPRSRGPSCRAARRIGLLGGDPPDHGAARLLDEITKLTGKPVAANVALSGEDRKHDRVRVKIEAFAAALRRLIDGPLARPAASR